MCYHDLNMNEKISKKLAHVYFERMQKYLGTSDKLYNSILDVITNQLNNTLYKTAPTDFHRVFKTKSCMPTRLVTEVVNQDNEIIVLTRQNVMKFSKLIQDNIERDGAPGHTIIPTIQRKLKETPYSYSIRPQFIPFEERRKCTFDPKAMLNPNGHIKDLNYVELISKNGECGIFSTGGEKTNGPEIHHCLINTAIYFYNKGFISDGLTVQKDLSRFFERLQ